MSEIRHYYQRLDNERAVVCTMSHYFSHTPKKPAGLWQMMIDYGKQSNQHCCWADPMSSLEQINTPLTPTGRQLVI